MIEVNPTHERILKFIDEYMKSHGNQTSTLREIGGALHIHVSTVHQYLNELFALGLICRKDKKYWISEKGYEIIK